MKTLLLVSLTVLTTQLSAKNETAVSPVPHANITESLKPPFDEQWDKIQSLQQSMIDRVQSLDHTDLNKMQEAHHQLLIQRKFRDAMIEKYFEELKKATILSMNQKNSTEQN